VVPDVVGMGMKPEELIQGFSRWVRDRSDIEGFRRPGSFDIACSVLTFMHVAEKKAALQNIVDSLRTGGYVVLSIDHGSDSLDFGDWSVDLYSWPPERYDDVLAGMGCEVSESIHLIDSWVGPDGQRSETHEEPIATVIKAIKPR